MYIPEKYCIEEALVDFNNVWFLVGYCGCTFGWGASLAGCILTSYQSVVGDGCIYRFAENDEIS